MIARIAFVATTAAFAGVLVLASRLLPGRVPLHFDASGTVDRWAGRGEALLTMGLVGGGVALLLGGVAVGARRLPMRWANLPHKEWWTATQHRERRVRTMLETDMYVVGAATMALLVVVQVLTIRAARLPQPALDAWAWVALGVYLVGLLGWAAHVAVVRYRPETA